MCTTATARRVWVTLLRRLSSANPPRLLLLRLSELVMPLRWMLGSVLPFDLMIEPCIKLLVKTL
jgi:hypothetical protein